MRREPEAIDVSQPAKVHPTALVEDGVVLGDGTAVWDSAHLRGPSTVGRDCIIGEKSYVAYGVRIGDRVKVNAFVYLCTGVTLEDGVMVSAGTVFTNDRYPRATTADLTELRPSDPDEDTTATLVGAGATIGARAVIGPGVDLGRFSMVAAGAVVTHDVADFHLVAGLPARTIGLVCRCGPPLLRVGPGEALGDHDELPCVACHRRYAVVGGRVKELDPT